MNTTKVKHGKNRRLIVAGGKLVSDKARTIARIEEVLISWSSQRSEFDLAKNELSERIETAQ